MSDASQPLLHLPATVLESLGISERAVADAVADGVRAVAAGRAWSRPKINIVPDSERLFQAMLAASETPAYAMVKAVGVGAQNTSRGLPHIGSTVTLMDGETGLPVALIDGAWITGVRTAAISALAGRYLAGGDLRSIGFVGCGLQAQRHLAAFVAEHPIERVGAVSRTVDGAQRFTRWVGERFGIDSEAGSDVRAVIEDVDAVVTSVPAAAGLEPFLDPAWVRPGAFVAACDLGRSWRPGFDAFDVVAIDDRAQDVASGHPLLPPGSVSADLGELVTGAHAGRTAANQRTAFVFRGLAIGDLAAAWLVYEHAREHGQGESLAR